MLNERLDALRLSASVNFWMPIQNRTEHAVSSVRCEYLRMPSTRLRRWQLHDIMVLAIGEDRD